MKSVFELIAKHIEPSLKRHLVEALLKRGLSGTRIARCMGVSPSLVTRYAKKERGVHELAVFEDVALRIDRLADRVVSENICGSELYYELAVLVFYVLARKYACGIHYSVDRGINPARCNVCSNLFKEIISKA